MNFNDNIPIYIQIINSIKKDIVSSKLQIGQKILSVREMAEYYNVNPSTVQRAYQELEKSKVINVQRGLGTFITDKSEMIEEIKVDMADNLTSHFIEEMMGIGFTYNQIVENISRYARRE
ncbi:GntR family transcriptional regulator [Cellulosilyticum ruminicola]|uniref:GntR family transcriptional regulator n=1 Tax=Cellulosilyticum ruminicola TaxID=425254 RepID=UPI0006CFC1A1|nr:GntR family transcriptional regulator [Cellulosilyticum ruminicola]